MRYAMLIVVILLFGCSAAPTPVRLDGTSVETISATCVAAMAELSFGNRNNAFVRIGDRPQIIDRAVAGTAVHEDKFETEWETLIQYGIDQTANGWE